MTAEGKHWPGGRFAEGLRRHHRLLAVFSFAALLGAVYSLSGLAGHFELATLRQAMAGHPAGGLLLFVTLFVSGNLLQIPGWLFLAAAVLSFGALWGGIATYLAASLSCAVTFLLVRLIGGNALRQFDHPWARRLLQRLDAAPVRSVAGLRLIFQTLPALNYALALSGVGWRSYLAGTLLGLPLPILLYCLFFERIAAILGWL